MSEKKPSQPVNQKKTYEKPKLYKHGNIKDFTRTLPTGGKNDGGVHPANKADSSMTMCVGGVTEVEEHRILVDDVKTQEAFQKAIHDTVKPGDVVLDLGTGSGIHAMFAVQAGAQKVYAVDLSAIIAVAEQIAEENGMSDKIEFLIGEFDDIEVPEKVDVIITHTGFLVTAKELPKAVKKWLKPGGKLVPGSIFLSFVPADLSEEYKSRVDFWEGEKFGLDFSAFRRYSAGFPHVGHFSPESFLAEPVALVPFDLQQEPNKFEWDMEFLVKKSGFISGLMGWYTYDLTEDIQISAKPPIELHPQVWKQPFLPMQKPIAVKEGQKINCRLLMFWHALPDGDIGWKWSFNIEGEEYSNNSFESVPLSKQLLNKFQN